MYLSCIHISSHLIATHLWLVQPAFIIVLYRRIIVEMLHFTFAKMILSSFLRDDGSCHHHHHRVTPYFVRLCWLFTNFILIFIFILLMRWCLKLNLLCYLPSRHLKHSLVVSLSSSFHFDCVLNTQYWTHYLYVSMFFQYHINFEMLLFCQIQLGNFCARCRAFLLLHYHCCVFINWNIFKLVSVLYATVLKSVRFSFALFI